MKKFLLVAAEIFILSNSVAAQNFCTNGNFDTFTTPPNSYAQICRATGWFSPSGICSIIAGTGSPDYYSTFGSGGAQPPATWWATVNPHSGGGMAGFVTWYTSINYREYISRQLSSPLVAGQTYQVTFWVTNGVSWLHLVGTNNIGVNFSLAPLVQSLGSPILLTPQFETSSIIYNTGWQQVTFLYTATAAYQYVTIGNFHNDVNTQKQSFGSGTYANYGAYYYIDDIVIEPAILLPVELLLFEAVQADNTIELKWATASEQNSDYFDIEKSENGIDFISIGKAKAQGNSNAPVSYHFTDASPDYGYNYYRLKQVDLDGSYEYSECVLVRFENQPGEIRYWFNASSQKIILHIGSEDLTAGKIEINDISGRKVYSSGITSAEMIINTSEFSPSVYILTVYLKERKHTFKMPLFR